MPQRVGRGIALLFHDRGTRRWVSGQQHAPAALYPRGKTRYPLYRRLGGPQGRSGRAWKSRPHRDSITGPSSAVAQTLYRLSYWAQNIKPYVYLYISLNSSYNEKCFRQKLYRKSKDTFCVLWLFPENRTVCQIMWGEYCRAGQGTDGNMAGARCTSDTLGHKHALTIWNISFPLQQWLHERSSVILYAHIACLIAPSTTRSPTIYFPFSPWPWTMCKVPLCTMFPSPLTFL